MAQAGRRHRLLADPRHCPETTAHFSPLKISRIDRSNAGLSRASPRHVVQYVRTNASGHANPHESSCERGKKTKTRVQRGHAPLFHKPFSKNRRIEDSLVLSLSLSLVLSLSREREREAFFSRRGVTCAHRPSETSVLRAVYVHRAPSFLPKAPSEERAFPRTGQGYFQR